MNNKNNLIEISMTLVNKYVYSARRNSLWSGSEINKY